MRGDISTQLANDLDDLVVQDLRVLFIPKEVSSGGIAGHINFINGTGDLALINLLTDQVEHGEYAIRVLIGYTQIELINYRIRIDA